MNVAVITPVGRENESLTKFIEAVQLEIGSANRHYLITDDFTDEKTINQIERAVIRYENLVWHHIELNTSGIAAVYLEGYRKALQGDGEYFLEIDAGFSHNPKEISEFLKAAQNFDVVFGNRFSGSKIYKSSFKRKMISRGGSILARLVSRTPISDLTSGYQCFSKQALLGILNTPIHSKGPFFQTEMKIRAFRLNYKIIEIPITYENPTHNVNPHSLFESLKILFLRYRWSIKHAK